MKNEALAQLRFRHALAASYSRRRQPDIAIPKLAFPAGARVEYYTALRKMLTSLRAEVDGRILPQLARVVPVRIDAAAEDIAALVREVDDLEPDEWSDTAIKSLASRVANDVSITNRAGIGEQLSRGLGFDILPRDPGVSREIDIFMADNVRLVKSIRADLLDELHGIILRGARSGDRDQVQREIAARFDVADSRAELIAVDQIGTLNGELTRIRQTAAGVEQYEWDDSHDGRVRKDHRDLRGTIQTWGKPPITNTRTGARNEPGKDFRCRCGAIPVLKPLLDAVGT